MASEEFESTKHKFGYVGRGPERHVRAGTTNVADHWAFIRRIANKSWPLRRGRRYQAVDFMCKCASDIKPKRAQRKAEAR
jgi:hypothetical protein